MLEVGDHKDKLIGTTKQLRNTIDTNIWIYLNQPIKYWTAMNSNNHPPNTNKFIIKLVAMMKVPSIRSRNFPKSSTGAKTARNFRFITFNCLQPKSIPTISPPPTINRSYDKLFSTYTAQHVWLQQNVQTQELHQLQPPTLPQRPTASLLNH